MTAPDDPKRRPKVKPGKTPGGADWDDDKGTDWRHAPVAPVDEGPLDSLGRSVSEPITGTAAEPRKKPKP